MTLSPVGRHTEYGQSAVWPGVKLARSTKIWSCFSVTKFGSPTALILLESGSSADERFRVDLK